MCIFMILGFVFVALHFFLRYLFRVSILCRRRLVRIVSTHVYRYHPSVL
jgi:hypothetical protein